MLTIRDGQMAALAEAAAANFAARVLLHVERIFPARVREMGAPQAGEVVRRALARAAGHGLRSERAATLFVDLVFGLGEDFDQRPENAWIGAVLGDASLTGELKMLLVYRDLRLRGAEPEEP